MQVKALAAQQVYDRVEMPASSNCRRKSWQDGKLRVLAMRVAQGQVCQLPSSLAHTRAEGARLVTCRVPTLV